MHNKNIKVLESNGWFTRGRIYLVTEEQSYRRYMFTDIKTGENIFIDGYRMPTQKYRVISNTELWIYKHWMALLTLLITICLIIGFTSCTKHPIDLNQPQKTGRPLPCQLKYFTGTYLILNKSAWLFLDSIVFTIDDTRVRAEYTQQTTVNDTPIYYHALATCDSLWTFSNEGLGINHIVRFDTAGILVDSLVVAGNGYGVNRYKRL